MKKSIVKFAIALMAASALAADSSPKDEVIAAAKNLGAKANYSWKTTVAVPEDTPFRPGPTVGQTEKDGATHLTLSFGDNTTEVYLKGDRVAVTNPDGGWQSLDELANSEGPGRFMARMLRDLKAPAAQAADIVSFTKELKKEGDVYTSDLTEAGAKNFLAFRRRGAGGEGPSVSDAKGSAKFWIKDGVLSKFEFKLTGKMDFGGNEMDVDRTTTVEVKDIGTTKVQVPDEANKKLSPEPKPAAASVPATNAAPAPSSTAK